MRRLSAGQRKTANLSGEPRLTQKGTAVPHFSELIAVVAEVASRQWPRKTAMELALRAEISERQAKEIISRRATGLSGDTLANLLFSDVGFAFLAALVSARPERERPDWWGRIKRQMQLSDARRALEEQRRQLEKLELEAGE